ncbi:CinA family protein [Lachnospiraceae bacterium 29-91]
MQESGGQDSLEEQVVRLLKTQDLTITAAESCTGGMIAGTLVNVAGASDVFGESYVTYSNEAKHRLVGVNEETLKQFGAVSEETAYEMAAGAARAAGADVGLSSTGIAGPGGGTPEKPVGLVYIGCFVCGKVQVRQLNLHGSREQIRRNTVEAVLKLAAEMLMECEKR